MVRAGLSRTYVERGLAPEIPRLLHGDNRQLQHHGAEAVPAQLLRDAAHDELVRDGTDEEGDDHCDGFGELRERGEVDVAAEEVVDGDVPLAGEFEPISLHCEDLDEKVEKGQGGLYQSQEFHQSE